MGGWRTLRLVLVELGFAQLDQVLDVLVAEVLVSNFVYYENSA
jgi:hypothetical protein